MQAGDIDWQRRTDASTQQQMWAASRWESIVHAQYRLVLCTCGLTAAVLLCVCVLTWTARYGGPGVELSAQHDHTAAVFHIFMFNQVLKYGVASWIWLVLSMFSSPVLSSFWIFLLLCDVVAILVISLTTRLVYNVLVLSWAGCRDFFGPFWGHISH